MTEGGDTQPHDNDAVRPEERDGHSGEDDQPARPGDAQAKETETDRGGVEPAGGQGEGASAGTDTPEQVEDAGPAVAEGGADGPAPAEDDRSGRRDGTPPGVAAHKESPAKPAPAPTKGARRAASRAAGNLKDSLMPSGGFWDRMNSELGEIPVIRAVGEYVGFPPLLVAMCFAGCAAGFFFCGFGGHLICTTLGVMYPAFESFKVVEEFANLADLSQMYSKAAAMQFWLIYWIVVAFFACFEHLFYYVLIWIPFYYPGKLAALLWLQMPWTRGADTVYYWLVSPILRRNRHSIDNVLEESRQKIVKGVSGAVHGALDAGVSASVGGAKHFGRSVSRTFSPLSPSLATVASFCLQSGGGQKSPTQHHHEE